MFTTYMPQTDKKSKILFYVLLLVVLASVALTYYRTMVARDYYIIESVDKKQQ